MGHGRFIERSTFAPAPSAGSLDAEHVAGREVKAVFSGEFDLFSGSFLCDGGGAWCAVFSALQSPGTKISAVGEQGHLRIGEQFDFADEAVAAAKFAFAAGAVAKAVVAHAERIGVLERLNGRVK